MSITTEIVTRLKADAGLTALTGGRVSPSPVPQDPTYPLNTYEVRDLTPLYDLDGELDRDVVRMQIESWGVTYESAEDVANAVRLSLSGFNGLLTTLRATIKLDINLQDYDDDVKAYRILQEYTITYK